MDWSKLVWSKYPDGRRKFGFIFYAVPMIAFLAGLGYYVWSGEQASSQMRGQGVSADRLSRAVHTTSKVEQPPPATTIDSERDLRSVREAGQTSSATPANPNPASGGSNALNALDIAVQDVKRPVDPQRQTADQPVLPGAVRYDDPVELVTDPAPSAESRPTPRDQPQPANPADVNLSDLVVYRRKTETSAPAQASPPQQPAAKKWTEGKFLPRGHPISLYLLEFIRTDQAQPLIIFGVARDVKFHGKIIIPFGTRLLTTVSGTPSKGNRVAVAPSSFQFPDGTELAVSGVMKGADKMTGLPAYYMPPPTWVQLSGYVNDFLSGYLALIYDRQQSLNKLQIGSVTVGASTPAFDPKLEAISATSQVIRDFASRNMDELQARYAPFLIVPPGTPAEMELIAPLTLETAGIDVAPLQQPRIEAPEESLVEKARAAAADAAAQVNNATTSVGNRVGTALNGK